MSDDGTNGGQDFDDFLQTTLDVNLNSVSQTIVDITADWLVSEQILKRIDNELSLNMQTSVVFHILDEIVGPAVYKQFIVYADKIPLIGGWIQSKLLQLGGKSYLKTLAEIVTLLMLQKTSGNIDVIEMAVIMTNTYLVNYGAEVKVIKTALDKKFDW